MSASCRLHRAAFAVFVLVSLLGCAEQASFDAGEGVLWQTGMEQGDLVDWSSFPGEETSFDSGTCDRPPRGVTEGLAYQGDHALLLRALTPRGTESGCRQFRFPEANRRHEPRRYSFWLYLPHDYEIGYWAMVAQFKSRTPDGRNDSIWSLQLQNRADGKMVFVTTFKCQCEGPGKGVYERDAQGYNLQVFKRPDAVVEARRWTRIEIDRLPSETFDGAIRVRQDGEEIFAFDHVVTTYEGGSDSFSLTAYGEDVYGRDGKRRSEWFETVFDDVKIEAIDGWL
ncbi:MAG: hypothetical protein R3F54_16840 [Alphaproteobacteria bacterium]